MGMILPRGDQLTVGSTCKGTCLGDLSHGSGEPMDERDWNLVEQFGPGFLMFFFFKWD